jgi:hypothetical protein
MGVIRHFLIEIRYWNCPYFVQLSPASTPPEYRFQGGLLFTANLEIEGRALSPPSHEGKPVRIWVRTSGSDRETTEPRLGWIGDLEREGVSGLGATLELAGIDLTGAAACLGASWKFIRIDAEDRKDQAPNVTAYAFSAT